MLRFRSLALAVAVVLSIASGAVAASTPPLHLGSTAVAMDPIESAILNLQAISDSSGGLGIYRDSTGWVLAQPVDAAAALSASALGTLGIPVRVVQQAVQPADLASAATALEGLRTKAGGAFGFGYEPEEGRLVVQSEAPESAFAAIESAYPGLIEFRPGKWALASWSNDGPPHWGGAWLQGGGWLCTSGYSMADNSGHKYMLTAGHCFPNGTSTNMGTAVRPSSGDPWPYWDAELISGETYAGYVYVNGTGGDPVKNAANPGVGYHYCTVGRASGFKCGWTVRVVNKTMCFPDQSSCFHNLAGFTNTDGSNVHEGDSGGPLYARYSDYTVGVRGTVSGYFFDIGSLSYWSYATMYQPVADYYVMHALIP